MNGKNRRFFDSRPLFQAKEKNDDRRREQNGKNHSDSKSKRGGR